MTMVMIEICRGWQNCVTYKLSRLGASGGVWGRWAGWGDETTSDEQ